MPSKKVNYQKLEKQLTIQKKSCWERWNPTVQKKAFDFAEGYKRFINAAKTEKESVNEGVKIALKNGYRPLEEVKELKPGDKVYAVNRNKTLALVKVGKRGLNRGARLVMAHIDSPRLDFKVYPLYEEESIAFLKTHYYGGIKKYQWPTIALALHGVVYLANGKSVEIVIGEKEDDPIFMITDLLPHLDRAGGPGSKISARQIEGEELNLVVGSMPIKDEKIKERVKLAVLEHLHKHYGIVEEDLASAELHAVPSEKARDLGFDRSLISGYGHDDRSCAYASLLAFLGAKLGDETQVCFWVDREEIGSEGNTGAKSMFVEMLFSELLRLSGERFGINNVYHIFTKSKAISADVAPAVDPDYKDVHDLRNAHRLGFGVAMERYTGSGGKYHSSEASGQLVQEIRMIFARTPNIVYQLGGGLGKIDKGGGGTIAMYLANRNMDIVDMGVPVLNMHAPLEIISKADLYAAYLAYQAFLAG